MNVRMWEVEFGNNWAKVIVVAPNYKEAAIAYDLAALKYFKGFAWLNRDHFTELKKETK